MKCELCKSDIINSYARDEKRAWDYWHCQSCDLVFRDPQSYLEPDAEKARYETHNNSIENEGYVRFLTPAVELLRPYLNVFSHGLDYGCGPGPIISILFSRHEIKVDDFDPYFFNDPRLLKQAYDFLTCTEVIEHLYKPRESFEKMDQLLKPGGLLLLMTDPRPEKEKFLQWGYRMDNTHVCFYSAKTFQWLAQELNYEILSCEGKLTLLRKKS